MRDSNTIMLLALFLGWGMVVFWKQLLMAIVVLGVAAVAFGLITVVATVVR